MVSFIQPEERLLLYEAATVSLRGRYGRLSSPAEVGFVDPHAMQGERGPWPKAA